MKKAMLVVLGAVAMAAPAAGQTIAQGMTPAEVRAEFGSPARARDAGAWTYWYYNNGCPNRCGSDDVVFFQNERVVAAVLRTPRRAWRGPRADDALRARDDGTSAVQVNDGTAVVGGLRMDGAAVEGTPVPAREGRPGEAPTIVIGEGTPQPGSVAVPVTAVEVEVVELEVLPPVEAAPAPAANTEATDLEGQTSIDRNYQRTLRERKDQETATQRASQNDRRGNP